MTQKRLYFVFSNAVEGRDDEYNDWYNTTHIPEILTISRFKSAQRFKASTTLRAQYETPFKYVTIYEVEGDAAEIVGALREWSGSDRSSGLSSAVAPGLVGGVFEAITEVIEQRSQES
jgi:hypothetical protein